MAISDTSGRMGVMTPSLTRTKQTYGPWVQDGPPDTQSGTVLNLLGTVVEAATPSAVSRSAIRTLRSGSITGIVLNGSVARTSGTATATVTLNGTTTSLTAVLDGTNTLTKVTLQNAGVIKFNSGDAVGVQITTAGWGPSTAALSVWVELVR